MAIPAWITVSIVALWVLVLGETALLLLLLRGLGQLRLQSKTTSGVNTIMPKDWGPAIGMQVPSFTAEDPQHRRVSLEDYQGRKQLLLFISPTCSACARAIESLNVLHQQEPDLELLVLGSTDYKANQAYVMEHQLPVPILTPEQDLAREIYDIKAIPYAFMLDEQGKVRAKDMATQENILQRLFEEAFQANPIAS